jgi:intracellular septation protein A
VDRTALAPARPGSGGTAAVLFRSLKGAIYGFIPMIAFYIAQRTGGVKWAVGFGVGLSVAIIPLEQRMTGTMRWCWIGLVGVVSSGVLALVTHNPRLFFLKSVVGDGTLGLAMLGSLAIGKPLVAMFAGWAVKIPDWYKSTRAYKQSFGLVTLAWGLVNVMRAAGRGYMVARGTLGQVMVVNLATGWPVFAALVAFSVWYPRRLAHRYVASVGGHEGMVDEILLGGVEEAFDVELAVGAEE